MARRTNRNANEPRSAATETDCKQKAKRSAKRSILLKRSSTDPTVRLEQAGRWPIVQVVMSAEVWDTGIGYFLLARQEPTGRLVFGVFLVDVFCLGVKNAFWRDGTRQDLNELIGKMETKKKMRATTPACLAKIVTEAVEFAQSFGLPPHPDYRHTSKLLDGIDPSECPDQFTFGRNGRPFYIQGPNESPAQAEAISQRIHNAGGHFIIGGPVAGADEIPDMEDDVDDFDSVDDGEHASPLEEDDDHFLHRT
jgi:hypothetical protein